MTRITNLGFAAALLLALVPEAYSAELIPFPGDANVDTLVVPDSSPAKFVSFKNDSYGKVAIFSGRFVVTGTYYYGYLGMEGEKPGDLTLYIDPDPQTAATLPHWKERGGPNHIYISDDKDFAKAIITPKLLSKLKAKTLKSVHGRISIIVTDYQASIECDAPQYAARFISVIKQKPVVLSQAYTGFGCG